MEQKTAWTRGDEQQRRRALVWLSVVCLFWGATFPLMKSGTAAIEAGVAVDAGFVASPTLDGRAVAPLLFLALRYGVACCGLPILLLVHRGMLRNVTRRSLLYGALLALLFLLSMYLQIYGLRLISPAVSAFVTSTMVVFVPLVLWAMRKKTPALGTVAAAALALAGVGLMTMAPVSAEPVASATTPATLLGVALTLGCALAFSLFVIFTNYATEREHPAVITVWVILLSFLGTVAALGVLCGDFTLVSDHGVRLMMQREVAMPVVLTAVLATLVATYVWNRWQREIAPDRAALLYMLEPLFAALISMLLGMDVFSWFLAIGALCIIAANVWSERKHHP